MDFSYTHEFRQKGSFTIWTNSLLRQHKTVIPVETIGYAGQKDFRVRCKYPAYGFSFILKGKGSYRLGSDLYPVSAPCVLVQKPGELMDFGPEGEWEEFFAVFNLQFEKDISLFNYDKGKYPFWKISDIVSVRETIGTILRAMEDINTAGVIDRIDLLIHHLIQSARTDSSSRYADKERHTFNEIISRINHDFVKLENIEKLVLKSGMHPARFRRLWNRINAVSPGKYLLSLKMAAACRLLVETAKPIKAVAQETGFDDPLYFSRRFKLETGLTASEYRKKYLYMR